MHFGTTTISTSLYEKLVTSFKHFTLWNLSILLLSKSLIIYIVDSPKKIRTWLSLPYISFREKNDVKLAWMRRLYFEIISLPAESETVRTI